MRRIWWLVIAVAGIAGLYGLTRYYLAADTGFKPQPVLANGARFETTPCWFKVPATQPVYCGWLHTSPVAANTASVFQLPVVVLPYQGEDRQPDPMIYLAGGPGSSLWLDKNTLENYWLDWFKQKAPLKRDLVLFDQRGSGLSKPAMHCDGYRNWSISVLSNPGTPEENAQRYYEVTRQCQQQLYQQHLPVDELGTTHSAQDVHDLLDALGYPQANLWGISYGTRLAFEIQSLYPERVRSMVLDSVYPPGEHLFREWPKLLNDSLERLFGYCANSHQCVLENGDIRAHYYELMKRLRQQPMIIPVDNLNLGNLRELRLNDEILLAILFDAQYVSHSLEVLPGLLRHLQENQPEKVRGYIGSYLKRQLDDAFHDPIFWKVECHDNPPIVLSSMQASLKALPQLSYYIPLKYDVCEIWNKHKQPHLLSMAKQPIQTPALILAGEDDPITPVQWAARTAEETFAEGKSYLFRFAGIAHGVLDSKPCTQELFVRFVQKPNERPRADCRFD